MTSQPLIGSVCTGYGGLDMAVQRVFGGELAWVADNDPGASRILAHHYPTVPNLGDITAVDWAAVPPVDVLTAGFPCQDLSYAGRGAGIKEGTRSGLWKTVAHAVGVLRPGLLVLENVAAIVARRPGLDVVAADLAALGLDAEWCCVRASDVGAPHRRDRWFCLAWPADPESPRWEGPRLPRRPADGGRAVADAHDQRGHRDRPRGAGRDEPAARRFAPADTTRLGGQDEPRHDAEAQFVAELGAGDRADLGNLAEGAGRPGGGAGIVAWGAYEPAIRRWEHLTGRPAPRPTDDRRRLAPAFVEWLMGLPAGWVTAVPGLTRTQQLHALGNGVAPRQAVHALTLLCERLPRLALTGQAVTR